MTIIFWHFFKKKKKKILFVKIKFKKKKKPPMATSGIAVPLNTFCKIPFISAKSGGIQSAKQAEISITKI